MFGRILRAIDRFQQRHPAFGFSHAVLKKFGDDNGGHQATLLAYYGFFSILPLLLVAVTVLGFVLKDNTDLQEQLLDSALTQFPIIGEDISEQLQTFPSSGIAFAIGLVGALWGGLGGIRAMQDSMNIVWDVPLRERPNFFVKVLRALIMLSVLGAFMLASTALQAVGTIGAIEGFARAITLPLAALLNVVIFLLAFKLLTSADVSWGDVAPGAIIAGVGWAVLQAVGTLIVGNRLEDASALYGFFGITIGLLAWLYLVAQVTLLAAEVNVVRKERLWPRAIDLGNLIDTDRIALGRRARVEERVKGQHISVSFDDPDDTGDDPDDAGKADQG